MADYSKLFIVDVEATDKTPMTGVMTEFAIAHVVSGATFYGHLYAFNPHPDIPALPVVDVDEHGNPVQESYWIKDGKDMSRAVQADDHRALAAAAKTWVDTICPGAASLVSDNNGFDAMWFNCFTDAQGEGLVFGHSSRRIGDFYAGTKGKWSDHSSWKRLRDTAHTHHPVDDVNGNREALLKILDTI